MLMYPAPGYSGSSTPRLGLVLGGWTGMGSMITAVYWNASELRDVVWRPVIVRVPGHDYGFIGPVLDTQRVSICLAEEK